MSRGGVGEDADTGFVGGGEDGFAIEQERAAGFEGEAGGTGGAHGFDGAEADDGDVEAHVLVGLGDFDDGERAAEGGGGVAEAAHEVAGAGDGGVGAFHGFDGDAGLGRDDDGLAEIVGGDGAGYGAAVGDVFLLVFGGGAAGEDAGGGEERLEILRRGDELDAFVGENLGDGAEEHVGVSGAEIEEEFGEAPVGADGGEDLGVFDLAGHGGAGDAFALEGFDEAGEFAEGEPVDADVWVGGGSGVDLGVGFFLDGGDDYGEAVGAGGVKEKKGEAAVAGDDAESLGGTPPSPSNL